MNNIEEKIERLEKICKDLMKKNDETNMLLTEFSQELKTLKAEARTGNTHSSASTYGVSANYTSNTNKTIKAVNTSNWTNGNSRDSTYASSVGNARNFSDFSSVRNTVNTESSAASFDVNAILSEYNKIFEYSGNDSKIARDNFARKYSVVGISCSNYAERVNAPSIPVVFETTQSLAKAHIWIIDVKTKYYMAVLNPNRGYDEPTHEFAGMKDVFNSNYRDGAYNSFRLIKPAIFQNAGGTWKVIGKGEIRL